MYIPPDTTIYVCKNVYIDNTYTNTLFFQTESAQRSFFASKRKYTLTDYTYQRQNNAIRVGIKSDNLWDCSYLAFQNTSFGSKWFYAFITNVEYVNNTTADIFFEIDVLQTFWFDFDILPCFVEREHPSTDNPGDNIIAENIDIGEVIEDAAQKSNTVTGYMYYIFYASTDAGKANGKIMGGIYSGCDIAFISSTDPEEIEDFLNEQLGQLIDLNKADSIVGIFLLPIDYALIGRNMLEKNITGINKPTAVGDYIPKNKKLLTYPYSFLSLDCLNDSAIYRYEWFENAATCSFHVIGGFTPNLEMTAYPVNYNSTGDNLFCGVTMTGFPQCTFPVDTYKAYLAQNSTTDFLNIAASIVTAGVGIATGNIAPAVMGTIGVANAVNNTVKQAMRPTLVRGQASSINDVISGKKDFWVRRMHITEQYAKAIDGYFDRYGYAVNQIKYPELNTRPHWNYVKVRDLSMQGNMPAEASARIKQIFNDGITFWQNNNEVGNYDLNNSPASNEVLNDETQEN